MSSVGGLGNPLSPNQGSSAFGDFITSNIGWNDLILPGSTYLNKLFDVNGSAAAQTQFQNQLALNRQNQAYNSEEARLQREWQEMMSSTEMQRRVKDLQAAGLNPYLALGSLGGSSVGSGSAASTSSGNADMANNKIVAAAGVLAMVLRMILTKGK